MTVLLILGGIILGGIIIGLGIAAWAFKETVGLALKNIGSDK